MYPTVVIVLVETQLSMMDVCELSSMQSREYGSILVETSNRLSFAVETRQTDKESLYERSCTFQVEDGQQHDWQKVVDTAEQSCHSERRLGA